MVLLTMTLPIVEQRYGIKSLRAEPTPYASVGEAVPLNSLPGVASPAKPASPAPAQATPPTPAPPATPATPSTPASPANAAHLSPASPESVASSDGEGPASPRTPSKVCRFALVTIPVANGFVCFSVLQKEQEAQVASLSLIHGEGVCSSHMSGYYCIIDLYIWYVHLGR